MAKDRLVTGCGDCPCMFNKDLEQLLFGCRLDESSDEETRVTIDPDFLEDVPESCPLFGGVTLRLSADVDPTGIREDGGIEGEPDESVE